ncbi:hypothetical protein [Pseudoroseomonas ludipueritiae]|uniref:Uncharacterized protein n=1 Tax=Pseudoroseomonas ludipueritiae TaxID=198093 RepID=A0ABR7RC23_9PROT|nr:hypothetical protein [Pseudoroseomonas ludipueritiae]
MDIGFAIPDQLAAKVVAQLRHHGAARRGWMGIELRPKEESGKAGARQPRRSPVVSTWERTAAR